MKLLSIATLVALPLLTDALPKFGGLASFCMAGILSCPGISPSNQNEPSPVNAAAAPAASGQDLGPQLEANINSLQAALTSVNDTLNTLTTNDKLGLITALEIQEKIGTTGDAITTATATCNQTAPLTDQESGVVATQILNLEPALFSVLNNIVEHKPAFATAILFVGDITKTVEANLVTQRAQTLEFSAALTPKLSAIYAAAAPAIQQQLDDAFVTAINAFQSCSGLLCLPPISFK